MFSILKTQKTLDQLTGNTAVPSPLKRNATKALCPLSQLPDMVNNTYTMACCSVSFFWYGFSTHPPKKHVDTHTHTHTTPPFSIRTLLIFVTFTTLDETFGIQYLSKVINNSKQLNVSNKIQ